MTHRRIKIFNKIDKPQKNKTNLSKKTQVTVILKRHLKNNVFHRNPHNKIYPCTDRGYVQLRFHCPCCARNENLVIGCSAFCPLCQAVSFLLTLKMMITFFFFHWFTMFLIKRLSNPILINRTTSNCIYGFLRKSITLT